MIPSSSAFALSFQCHDRASRSSTISAWVIEAGCKNPRLGEFLFCQPSPGVIPEM
jgi:hypothetical protein